MDTKLGRDLLTQQTKLNSHAIKVLFCHVRRLVLSIMRLAVTAVGRHARAPLCIWHSYNDNMSEHACDGYLLPRCLLFLVKIDQF